MIVFSSTRGPIPRSIHLRCGNDVIAPVKEVKNLGVIFDDKMKLESYVNRICQTAHLHLKNISRVWKSLDNRIVKKLFMHLLPQDRIVRMQFCMDFQTICWPKCNLFKTLLPDYCAESTNMTIYLLHQNLYTGFQLSNALNSRYLSWCTNV